MTASAASVFVVRSVLRCALGLRRNVSGSSSASRRLVTTPGRRLAHARLKAPYPLRAASALAA
jgi:hypothetical protein